MLTNSKARGNLTTAAVFDPGHQYPPHDQRKPGRAATASSGFQWCPVTRLSCGLLVAFARLIGVRVSGAEHIRVAHDPFIFALNHTHKLEALLVPALLAWERGGRQVHFLVDWNVLLVPGLASLIRLNEPIVVNRKPARPAWLNVFRSRLAPATSPYAAARERLRQGCSVGIYPEGTRNPDPGRLLRGLKGAARLSMETGAAVVPAGIRFSSGRSGELAPFHLHIGDPIHPYDGEDPCHEAAAWHEQIMRNIAILSGRHWNSHHPRTHHER